MKAEKVVYLFEQYIIANHEVFMKVISDKNTRFRSKFWQTLTALKEIKTKMSTTEHSQINDQIEKFNQIMKQYLKCYVNYQQDNWVELLFTAQFTYNNSMQTFTEISLFQAEYDKNMQINNKMIKFKENNETAIQQDKKMQQIHEQLKKTYNLYMKKWRFITIYSMKTYLCSEQNKKFTCHTKISKQNNSVKNLTTKK